MSIRWSDIDMYGHVNNAVYYEWFDSAINGWLADKAEVAPTSGEAIGVVGESACSFESELRLGDEVVVGLAVSSVSKRTVVYVLAVFDVRSGRRAALGHWVHVYVTRTGQPCSVPGKIADVAEAARTDMGSMTLLKLPLPTAT